METKLKYLLYILSVFFIVGCNNNEKQLTSIEFGKWKSNSDSLSVELQPNKFKNFRELLNWTGDVSCNDSIAKITINKESTIKTIYFQNPCWEKYACILTKRKNTIRIHNDSIYKAYKVYPLDSLYNIINRDVGNNGKDPMLCENPKKLLFEISYWKKDLNNLYNTLDILTDDFEKITNNRDTRIWFSQRIEDLPALPPPPLGQLDDIYSAK